MTKLAFNTVHLQREQDERGKPLLLGYRPCCRSHQRHLGQVTDLVMVV